MCIPCFCLSFVLCSKTNSDHCESATGYCLASTVCHQLLIHAGCGSMHIYMVHEISSRVKKLAIPDLLVCQAIIEPGDTVVFPGYWAHWTESMDLSLSMTYRFAHRTEKAKMHSRHPWLCGWW